MARSRTGGPGPGYGLDDADMRLSRAVRAVLSAICWTLAVAAGIITGASFAGGGFLCQAGRRTGCTPQTWVLVVGILVTFGFGVAGAVLYKPREKRTPRFPWEYPK